MYGKNLGFGKLGPNSEKTKGVGNSHNMGGVLKQENGRKKQKVGRILVQA